MDLIEKINRTAFLGSEFLTYLWFMSETSESHYRIDEESDPFDIFFDDRLTVGGAQVNAQENLFRGGHPTSSLEAHAALRLGKLATEARVRLVRGAQEWAFVLKAGDLAISALQVPAVLSKNDEDRFYERMYLVEELEKMLNHIYRTFLQAKLSDSWRTDLLPEIRAWVGKAQVAIPTRNDTPSADAVPTQAFDVNEDVLGDRPPWESAPDDGKE
jgi:hypothetical protein